MINFDFVKFLEFMGIKGFRCMKFEDLFWMMKEFLEYDGKRFIVFECFVFSEYVYFMIFVGKVLYE